jgi:hypothetical protein
LLVAGLCLTEAALRDKASSWLGATIRSFF